MDGTFTCLSLNFKVGSSCAYICCLLSNVLLVPVIAAETLQAVQRCNAYRYLRSAACSGSQHLRLGPVVGLGGLDLRLGPVVGACGRDVRQWARRGR